MYPENIAENKVVINYLEKTLDEFEKQTNQFSFDQPSSLIVQVIHLIGMGLLDNNGAQTDILATAQKINKQEREKVEAKKNKVEVDVLMEIEEKIKDKDFYDRLIKIHEKVNSELVSLEKMCEFSKFHKKSLEKKTKKENKMLFEEKKKLKSTEGKIRKPPHKLDKKRFVEAENEGEIVKIDTGKI